jgi:hypothetical protein
VHCRDHAVQVHRAQQDLAAGGLDVVLIGQASPRQAAAFRRKLKLDPLRVLADERRTTYKLAGLRKANLGQLLGPRSVASGIQHGLRSGVVQGRPVGDPAQLGGAAVIAPGGTVLLHQQQRHAGDTIAVGDLLAAAA